MLSVEIAGIDVLLAGPPCQGHSDLNNHTRRDDARNDLYVRVARAAEILQPRAVLIENVPAVQHDVRGSVPDSPRLALETAGYRVAATVLDLTQLGVPQRRRRHLMLGLRDRDTDPAGHPRDHHRMWRARPPYVEWAIGDLRGLGRRHRDRLPERR